MNLVILEGNLGSAPKKIGDKTFALRLAVHEKNNETLWIDGLYFNEELGLGLTAGQRILINGRLGDVRENQRHPKILVDTIEKK